MRLNGFLKEKKDAIMSKKLTDKYRSNTVFFYSQKRQKTTKGAWGKTPQQDSRG